ncbi:proline--tRNA ligase [Aneurinibacillus aneurinilyticus]|uniref:Proline--tRNA ligase n=2 Tax=Aneurinibacillus aneurinilyticus TaxID=1391 RepID=A0A848CQ01_ANEAE|nr:proline--tRNA ligase [Aneurinibacillus aneurinilyticus]ERI09248.1 proline--tRNA ligase [Aneurinibacillus aneurinilyticus ATCC 12856]MCI1692432.1 proline--tRNA ligase [Aneurinibacillus aneurinilyticus]MED0707396.1 proline--tRNA ligase [Aneurinibacillus aneurinilyticus]MED0724796.1 proline--tRNA ligase [Aneurinibacillus aneurinilyticus]MED0733246.1 proline--tRNA ligase [Aneurinibacillus aneurinilyticus]
MRQSKLFLPTLREVPAEAEIISHQLMVRAGLMRQLASGVYTYLPLGHRVLRKVQQIVREEMERADAQEISMPAIQPAELWQETGRWEAYGPELMRLKDRHNRDFVLGPTHEEVVTGLVRDNLNTYKKLPINLYQIQTKYRDEVRPRFGVIRSREFIMKDAYSFDTTREGLDKSYDSMYDAYTRIFTRTGLTFRAVEADAGAIGGKGTHEFMALSAIGEDTIAYCTSCDYAANLEKAEVVYKSVGEEVASQSEMEKVPTPDVKTIEQLMNHFDMEARQMIKALVFKADDRFVVALVRGDHELNDTKLKNIVDANVLTMATEAEMSKLGVPVGFVGPINLPDEIEVYADSAVRDMQVAVTGANEKDYHYKNVVPERDFTVTAYADLRNIVEGDECPRCGGHIAFARGIEVGHVFKLGTRYSEKMGAKFLDENGREQPMIMGCYGIGVSRTVAACVEQNNDENGIIWPWSLAPFHIHVVPVNVKNEEQKQLAESLYEKLQSEGFEVLLDDRSERAGVKFKDADLIGLPIRITVGGKAGEGLVECKVRKTGESKDIHVDELMAHVKELAGSLQ